MVRNKKFPKMPKISLAQNQIFLGGHHCFGPKTLLYFGPTFLVVFFFAVFFFTVFFASIFFVVFLISFLAVVFFGMSFQWFEVKEANNSSSKCLTIEKMSN